MLSAALTLLALFIAVIATPRLRRLRGKGMPEILAALLILLVPRLSGSKMVRSTARGVLFAPTRLSGSAGESECVAFVMDIIDRKCTEEALRGREASFGARAGAARW